MESYPMNSFSLGSPVHINPVTSRPRESDWAMMLGTLQRICEQLQVLTDVEQSMGELQAAMGLVQGSLVFQSQVIEQVRTVVCLAPSQTGTAGTESFELGEECSEPSVKQAPSNDPPMLPLVPGQVAQPVQHSAPPGPEGCPSASPRTPGGASSRSVRFQKPQKAASKNPKKFLRKPSPLVMRPALSKHTATVNQLEACVAQELLSMGRNRSSSRISSKDLENDEDVRSVVECAVRVEDEVQDDRTLGRNSNTSHRATLSADKELTVHLLRKGSKRAVVQMLR
ncbi:unnamed protein product, partial [Durusdinium trenchii]